MKQKIYLLILTILLSLKMIAQNRPLEGLSYRLYLIGGAGGSEVNPTLDLLKQRLVANTSTSGIIFLGDNISTNGLPHKTNKLRQEAEQSINLQINTVKAYKGDVFFIPGDRDWDNGGKNGWVNVREQELYIENALDSANVFYPDNGCPGPVEIHLTENIVLIIIDTEFFLYKGDKPDRTSSCGAKNAEEAFLQLHDILQRNYNKKIVVASHHPIYTKGIHGGVVTFKDHMFPLTNISESLWIPLPVVGSIYPVYRQTIGTVQDQVNLQHKAMIKAINNLLITHNDVVHISGHEQALQYLSNDGVNYVVSGSGSNQNTTVKSKRPSLFAGNYIGFGYLDYYKNGEVWLTFESPNRDKSVVFEKQISNTPFNLSDSLININDIGLPTKPQLMNASDVLAGKKSRAFFFGEGYREEWYQGVYAPVFDIGKEKEGLTILKKGGGNQTKSLRLEAKNGKQYVLRLLEKDASKLIPEQFRSNFVKKVVQEGISGSNPYAAFVVPPFAEAVNVYHTNPQLVFVPDDPRFGIYRDDFKNKLCLFEERASKNQEDAAYFGNSKKVINTPDMLAHLYKDNDNSVDQKAILRARLLDTYFGDWDRHDDQWRWAQINKKGVKGKLYQPIPRDRDQVFYISEGIIPTIMGANWAVPALQGFGPEVKNIKGLWSYAVKYFDRSFLTELERDDWIRTAKTMKTQLTDHLIETSIKKWPPEIYQYHGQEIISDLKTRRDNLDKYALEYYLVLAKKVDIVGSNKNEYFDVVRINHDTTLVKVYKINHQGNRNKVIYQRKFITSETKEISLYGLDGNDVFRIQGKVSKGPKIRVIGGNGDDSFIDKSHVGSLGRSWLLYDNKTGNEIITGKETKIKTSSKPDVNEYNRKAFNYNKIAPIIAIKFSKDDGVFLGGGFSYKVHGFRKFPFKSSHKFGGAVAIATGAFNIAYEGEFTDVLNNADLIINADVSAPNYVTNFFGIGNESAYDQAREINYYRVRFEQSHFDALLKFDISEDIKITIGSSSQMVDVEYLAETFIANFAENGLDSANLFIRKTWTGGSFAINIDTRDQKVLTESGYTWNTKFNYFTGLSGGANEYGTFSTAFAFYYSFRRPSRVTFSNRTGYMQTFGNPEFHQLVYLDGHSNLRGYRKYRFAAEKVVYNSTDLRIKLTDIRAFILPTQVGINFFYDIGKAFVDAENSDQIHQGYGIGLWIAPARIISLTINYAHSVEGWLPQFKFSVDL